MDAVLSPEAFGRAKILAQAFVDEVNTRAVGPIVTIAALQMTVINVIYALDPGGAEIETFINDLRRLAANAGLPAGRPETRH